MTSDPFQAYFSMIHIKKIGLLRRELKYIKMKVLYRSIFCPFLIIINVSVFVL